MRYATVHPVSCAKACIVPLHLSNTKYNDVRSNCFTHVLCRNESRLEFKVKSTNCKYVIAKTAGMSLEAIYRIPVFGLLGLGDGRTAFLQNIPN